MTDSIEYLIISSSETPTFFFFFLINGNVTSTRSLDINTLLQLRDLNLLSFNLDFGKALQSFVIA